MQKVQNAAESNGNEYTHLSYSQLPGSQFLDKSNLQNCFCVLELNHWFCPLLSFSTTAPLQPFPFFSRQRMLTQKLQPQYLRLPLRFTFCPHI